MAGRDPAKGARDTGRTDKGLGGGRSGGKGSEREDRALAAQIDKSRNLPGGNVGTSSGGPKSLGRQISDLFGGPSAYANNPNRPRYDTSTMGVPISTYGATPFGLMSGQNLGMSPGASMALNAATSGMSGIGLGMGLTRAIQAATGMSGGPAIGGRSDGLGAYGGQAGGDYAGKSGYALPQGYMQQNQLPATPQPSQPVSQPLPMLNNPARFLSPVPGYGVTAPQYSYFGPMKR